MSRYRPLADACGSRTTTPGQIRTALDGRARVSGRAQLIEMLDDLATGACSVLERGYLRLERAHGLPAADRQRPDRLPVGTVYRDVPYREYGLVVELDGRAHHEGAVARDRDMERDLDTVVDAEMTTVRLGYGQVFARGCSTVAKISSLLQRRGWPGVPNSCGPPGRQCGVRHVDPARRAPR